MREASHQQNNADSFSQILAAMQQQPHIQPIHKVLTREEIVNEALNKAQAYFSAPSPLPDLHAHEALFHFIKEHLLVLQEEATHNAALDQLLKQYLSYQAVMQLIAAHHENKEVVTALHNLLDFTCGSLVCVNKQYKRMIFAKLNISDQVLGTIRNTLDTLFEKAFRLKKLLSTQFRTTDRLIDIFIKNKLRKLYRLEACETSLEAVVHELITKNPDKAFQIEALSLARQVDELFSGIKDLIRQRNENFEAAGNLFSEKMRYVLYLAKEEPRLAAFMRYTKMNHFWEERLNRYLRGDNPDFAFQIEPHVDHIQIMRTATAFDILSTLRESSLASNQLAHSPIAQLLTQAEEDFEPIDHLPLLMYRHKKIRDQLKSLSSSTIALLIKAANLLTRTTDELDTSGIFPKTLKAQKLHGPVAILNEAKNKIALALALKKLSHYYSEIDPLLSKKYQQAAQTYALYAYRDICLSASLESACLPAISNMLAGQPLITMIAIEGYPTLTSFAELKTLFLTAHLECAADPILFNRMEQLAKHQASQFNAIHHLGTQEEPASYNHRPRSITTGTPGL